MTVDVILTGAESRQGIVTIRSLARRGVRMFVTGDQRRSIGFHSRHIEGSALSPPPAAADEFVDFHIDLARKLGVEHLFPITETSLIPLNDRRDDVEAAARLIAPSSHTIQLALDKKLTLEIAAAQGIPISRTLYPESIETAVEFAEDAGYPVVFKPRGQARIGGLPSRLRFKVFYARNRPELVAFLQRFDGELLPMMQDFSYGFHRQFNCFVEPHRAHSFFSDEAVRMLPLTGGVGAMMRSVELIPELTEHAIRIFRAMAWEGCGQAQFKGPGKDGSYRFIEVSVRLPASVGSAVYSGVDTPWMQYCYFTGRSVEPANGYKVGQRTRWLRGDTLTVARYLLNDTPEAVDPLPSRSRVLFDWLAEFFRPSVKYYVEKLSDPVPGVYEAAQTFIDVGRVLVGKSPRWVQRTARTLLGPLRRRA